MSMAMGNEDNRTVKVKSAGKVTMLPISRILYCKGAGDYVELISEDTTMLHSGSLAQLQKQLPSGFLKVHRSYLVNAQFIVGITRLPSGNGELLLSNQAKVPVSRALFAETKTAVLISH